jgi:hypothetical protein
VLPHAEIIVRTPDRHFATDTVIESPRKEAAAPFELCEETVTALGAQDIEALLKEACRTAGIPTSERPSYRDAVAARPEQD